MILNDAREVCKYTANKIRTSLTFYGYGLFQESVNESRMSQFIGRAQPIARRCLAFQRRKENTLCNSIMALLATLSQDISGE